MYAMYVQISIELHDYNQILQNNLPPFEWRKNLMTCFGQ